MLFQKKIFMFLSQCIIFIHTSFLQDQLHTKVLKIDRFDGKLCGKKVPIENYYSGLQCSATSLFIANSTVIIKENLVNNLKMTISLRRCNSRENLDSCEDFRQMTNLDYCQTMNPDGLLGQSRVAIPYQPKYKCPLKKGTYIAYNFTINLTPFIFFKLDNWYWRARIDIFAPKENKLIGCINIEAYTVLKSQA